MAKIERKHFLLGASCMALGIFTTIPEALAQVPCPGTESRAVTCRDYKGNAVADSFCTRVGMKPRGSRGCTATCNSGDGDGGGDGGDGDGDGGGDGDPLIFDLDGNGISLLSVEDGVMFDIDNDGERQQTGWVDSGDGLLVFDDNGNGRIDNQSELFGNIQNAAYKNLAEYDSNGDGVMNMDDRVWDKLQMWVDADTDGRTDRGELRSLHSYGISEIDLGYNTVEEINAGSRITARGSFTRWVKDANDEWQSFVSGVAEAFLNYWEND